jgi:hypothetical protein
MKYLFSRKLWISLFSMIWIAGVVLLAIKRIKMQHGEAVRTAETLVIHIAVVVFLGFHAFRLTSVWLYRVVQVVAIVAYAALLITMAVFNADAVRACAIENSLFSLVFIIVFLYGDPGVKCPARTFTDSSN